MLRFHLISRFARKELARLIHPHGIYPVRYGLKKVTIEHMFGVWGLFLSFTILVAFGALLFAAFKMPFITAVGSAIALLSSTGPLISYIDPTGGGFADMGVAVINTASFLMIAGRLEALLLLAPIINLLGIKN